MAAEDLSNKASGRRRVRNYLVRPGIRTVGIDLAREVTNQSGRDQNSETTSCLSLASVGVPGGLSTFPLQLSKPGTQNKATARQ